MQMYCNVESRMSEFAIQVKHLDKMYKLYNKPSDRLKEALGMKVPVREHYALRDVSFDVKEEKQWELSGQMVPVNPRS